MVGGLALVAIGEECEIRMRAWGSTTMKSAQNPASPGIPAFAFATRPIATSGTEVLGRYNAIETRAPT